MIGDNVYDLNNDLFKVLNLCKLFEVGMTNPRKGLVVQYKDKVFRLEPIELVGVNNIEEAFKILPN